MPKPKFMYKCFMCDTEFQMGPHVYNGRYIKRYNISVCSACYTASWDGWAPHYEERLIAHLKEKGLPIPERNEKGKLPRGI